MNQRLSTSTTPDEVIDSYRPRTIDLYQWLEIQPFVQEMVRGSQPHDPDEARRRMTMLGALVTWAHFTCGHPLEASAILHPGIISEFADADLTGYAVKVRAQYRARLKSIARKVNPEWPDDLPEETAYTTAWDPKPYTDDEITALEGWARGQRTAGRRNKAGVLLGLCLGAGLTTSETVRLRVGGIEVDDLGVQLHVGGSTPRTVPVMARFEEPLIELRKHIPAEEFAFSPGRTNRKSAVVHNFIKSCNFDDSVYPTPQRMRATWILNHIRAGVPASALLRAAGLTNLRSFERWVYLYPEFTTREYREWLGVRPRI